jgi:intein/homing endonuclease
VLGSVAQDRQDDWTPRQRIEQEYYNLIARLVDQYLQLPESATLGQIVESLVGFGSLSRFFEDASAAIASRMATQLRASNARSWREAARKGSRGLQIYRALEEEMETGVGDRVREIIAENARLIRSIPQQIQEQVTREIYRAEMAGARHERIAEYLQRRIPHLSRTKAALIARTETSKSATALTRARAENLGLTWYQWETSRDARVRRSHAVLQGVLVSWGDPPSPERLVGERSTLGKYHAGNAPNCFAGSLEVNLSNGCDRLWRRFYRGPVVVLQLADGAFVEATPNHPILTRDGWLPIDALQEGDYLVKAKSNRGIASQDHKDRLVGFGNLFDSLQAQIGSEPTPGSKLYFHGDGTEDQIDVVNPNRFLLQTVMAPLFQSIAEFIFSRPNVKAHGFPADCPRNERAQVVFSSAPGFLGSLCKLSELLWSQSRHPNDIGFASVSDVDAACAKHFSDSSPITVKFSGERQFALPGLIPSLDESAVQSSLHPPVDVTPDFQAVSAEGMEEGIRLAWNGLSSGGKAHPLFDSLVKVARKVKRDFEGHVFGLQSGCGWYSVTASNIIAHNCRCDSYPVIRAADLKWPHKVFRRGRIHSMTLARFRGLQA